MCESSLSQGKTVITESDATQPNVQVLNYLWDEYKYRHGMCWSAVLKVSATVTALAVLTYVRPELIGKLRYLMVVPPIMGTSLAVFGFFVVHNELKLFAGSKIAHNQYRNKV